MIDLWYVYKNRGYNVIKSRDVSDKRMCISIYSYWWFFEGILPLWWAIQSIWAIQVALWTIKPAFPGPWFSREVKNHCGALCCILVVHNTIWTDSYIMSTMTCVSLTQVNETELPTPNLNKNQVGRTDWSTLSWFQVFHWEKKSGAPWNSSVIRIYSCVSS